MGVYEGSNLKLNTKPQTLKNNEKLTAGQFTADFTAMYRSRLLKRDSPVIIQNPCSPLPLPPPYDKAMKKISKSSAFCSLLLSHEVSIFSVESFHVLTSRIILLQWENHGLR